MRQTVMEMPRSGPCTWMVFIGVVGLAAVVRAVGLGDRPLWLDEALSLLYARIDLSLLLELRRQGTNPPLYHLLLSHWVDLFGSSEEGLRSLSVTAGAAAVGLTYLLGRAVGGTAVGLVSAGMLMFSSIAVGFSQEARYYALVEMLAAAGSLLLHLAVTSRRASWMACYAAVMVVFVWTHAFAWFVLAAHAAAVAGTLLAPSNRSAHRRRLAMCFGAAVLAVAVSFLPWFGILIAQVRMVLDDYWVPRPNAVMLLDCTHGFLVPLEVLRWPVVAIASLGGVYAWRRRRRNGGHVRKDGVVMRFDWLMLCAWATLPICIPLLWSLAGTPIFQVKYALAAQPAMLILLSLLIVRRPRFGLFLVAALAAAQAPTPNRGLPFEDWSRAAAVIKAGVQPDAPVYVCQDYTYFALAYYLDNERYPITPVIRRPDKPNPFAEIYPRPPLTYEQWLDRLRQDDQAWIVLAHLSHLGEQFAAEEIMADLQKFGLLRVWSVRGDIDVLSWKPRGGETPIPAPRAAKEPRPGQLSRSISRSSAAEAP